MNSVKIMTCVCVGLLGAMMMPRAKADAWDQKTVFTFSAPVEVPGQVLQPGTYVFEISKSLSDRNVIEVFNKNQNHLYGMFDTIQDYHITPASRAIITFEERAAGAPPAVKSWFYPGANYGHEFLYRKVAMVASMAMPAAPAPAPVAAAAPTPQPAPVQAEQPAEETTQQSVVIAQATPPPAAAAPAPAPAPQSLPQTGSSMPLIGLMGLLSLAMAGLFQWIGRRSES